MNGYWVLLLKMMLMGLLLRMSEVEYNLTHSNMSLYFN